MPQNGKIDWLKIIMPIVMFGIVTFTGMVAFYAKEMQKDVYELRTNYHKLNEKFIERLHSLEVLAARIDENKFTIKDAGMLKQEMMNWTKEYFPPKDLLQKVKINSESIKELKSSRR